MDAVPYRSGELSILPVDRFRPHAVQKLILYAFPTYLPYWGRSEEAMKTADAAVSDLFYPNAKDVEQIASSLVWSLSHCSDPY